MSNWFSKHGAGIDKVEENMKDHFLRLKETEATYGGGKINNDRMVISEQTRLVTKELGWTLILAGIVDKLTRTYHERRVKREMVKAIAELRREGIIPEGYNVVLEEDVRLTKAPAAKPQGNWAAKNEGRRPASSANFAQAVDKSRAGMVEPATSM